MAEFRANHENLPLSIEVLAKGVIASTLTPFEESGAILTRSITDQAGRLARIDGIVGIAVNALNRERQSLSRSERLAVLQHTRAALNPGQLVLACVGSLSADVEDEVAAYREAGVDAVIISSSRWREESDALDVQSQVAQLTDLATRLPLPIIAATGAIETRACGVCPEIETRVRNSPQVFGVDMGNRNNVLIYNKVGDARKAIDRPLAYLPCSAEALFQNLDIAADEIISYLPYVAPHEIATLYQATRAGCLHDAQALYNRLSPLVGLISDPDKISREMVLRQIAHTRGLLASTDARGISTPLDPRTIDVIESTLDKIELTPIKWI